MSYRPRVRRDQLPPEISNPDSWPSVDKSALSGEVLELYATREAVVQGYFSGHSLNYLVSTFRLSRQTIHRLVERCLTTHPDGRIWGFRALLPYTHQKVYDRIAPVTRTGLDQRGGAAGALNQLFERHPDIREEVEAYFLKKTQNIIVHESRINYKSIFKRFIDACRAKGIKSGYPFNVKSMGYVALYNYLRKLVNVKCGDAVKARFGKEAARNLKLGGTESQILPVTRPYVRVEFDGHNIDITFILQIPSPYGGTTDLVIDRIWLLVMKEALSGAILGYHLSFGCEYSMFDVMQCIKKTIMPWVPRQLTLPGLKYPADGGMPSAVIKDLEWAIFQEFCYDNAKANLAEDVTRILVEVTGCGVNAGPVASPERRPLVERFFGLFEENGFHRLPSTLGNSPQDPRRQSPDKIAMKYKIRLEHIEDLVAVLIADYNGTPSACNGYRSPLEQLRLFVSDSNVLIPKLEEGRRGRLAMFNHRVVRTVRGNTAQGKRPYVQLEGVHYTNDIVATMPELIGQKLILYIDPQDPRSIEAFFSDGSELGVLDAKGFWGRTPHTLEMRRAIMRARNRQLIRYTENDDPIHIYMDYLNKEAVKSKKARRHLIKAKKALEQDTRKCSDQPVETPVEEPKHEKRVGETSVDSAMFKQKTITY